VRYFLVQALTILDADKDLEVGGETSQSRGSVTKENCLDGQCLVTNGSDRQC